MATKIKLLLMALIHVCIVLSTQTPLLRKLNLLNQDGTVSVKWELSTEAKNALLKDKFKNKHVHVIAIGGPTRAGKSFTMSTLLTKFADDDNGAVHFGTFIHDNTSESVTEGMDIALVEYKRKLILLID